MWPFPPPRKEKKGCDQREVGSFPPSSFFLGWWYASTATSEQCSFTALTGVQMSCVIGRDKIKCIRKNCFSVMERVKVHHFRKSHAQRTSLEGGASVANHRSLRVIKGILEYPVSYWMLSKILESCVPSSRMCLGKMRALLPTTSIGGISQRLLYWITIDTSYRDLETCARC